ncbi:MAG: hypothetical protein LC722_07455 [Actinobacteria bacterium]|nr:hypothetical protein [Actinomycetota bacterium]
MSSAPFVEVTVFGVSAGAVFGLLALGLVLIYRTTGVITRPSPSLYRSGWRDCSRPSRR